MIRHRRTKKATFIDRAEDVLMQQAIRRRADYSLAILGKAFVLNGSGRFLNIRATSTTRPFRRSRIADNGSLN